VNLTAVDLLQKLVAIPSQNPMGRIEPGKGFGEKILTDHLAGLFQQLELPYVRRQVHTDRENLIARLDGGQTGSILFEAHQDTVPVDGMTIDPWAATIDGDRLYGRGACDVKGGMAAMLAVLARLRHEPPANRPTVVMACSVNEEHGFTGARALGKFLTDPEDSFLSDKPAVAIVAEPTELDTVVAHKGVVRWKLHTTGRAAHSATPEQGQNAIYRMARLIETLEAYHRQALPPLGSHARCGRATLSVGTIHGGTSVNTIPDRCTVEIDRRLMPDETADEALAHLQEYLSQKLMDHAYQIDPPFLEAPSLSDADNGPLADQLGVSIEKITGRKPAEIGVPYATDAPAFAQQGIPTIVFGPGSIQQAHTKDEWISLSQLNTAVEILHDFVLRFDPS
jgi:acetylornithine deacetylase/succinyl-diaminopimelate desuccinylase family protein